MLSNLRLPWKTELPWNFSLYWIYFLHSGVLRNLRLLWKTEFALKFFKLGRAAAPPTPASYAYECAAPAGLCELLIAISTQVVTYLRAATSFDWQRRTMDVDVQAYRSGGSYQDSCNRISSSTVLRRQRKVTIECDSSEVGLGATLLQEGQPVSFASRALTPTEQRYAQIEKECLATVYACQRFNHYILGRNVVTIHSNHKPLETIFKKTLM